MEGKAKKMEKKQNPLTAMIFMIGILCAFVIAVPTILLSQKQPLTLGYLGHSVADDGHGTALHRPAKSLRPPRRP